MARTQGRPQGVAPADDDGVIDGEFDDDFDDEEGDQGSGRGGAPLATVRGMGAVRLQAPHVLAQRCQLPRDLVRVEKKVVDEAVLMGKEFYYSWTQGKGDKAKLVEGASIDGAMLLVRHYGNCTLDIEMMEEGPRHWLMRAWFIDLESGLSVPRMYRQRKGETHQRSGGDDDRLQDIAFQIGQSKAERNVIINCMPKWLINKAMETAKKAEEEDVKKNMPARVANAKERFAQLKVTPVDMARKLEKPESAWSPADIALLVSIYRAISNRDTTVFKEFPWLAPQKPADVAAGATGQGAPAPDTGAGQPSGAPAAQQSGASGASSTSQGETSGAPPATTAQAEMRVPCVVCGKEVPPDDAVYTGVGVKFRHGGCAPAATSTTQPQAESKPASAPTTPATPAAPQATTPSASEGGGRRGGRRRTSEGLEEPPDDVTLPNWDEKKS